MQQIHSHPAVARVRAALEEAGAQGQIIILDEHARTAAAAAEQLGVEVGQIANSLVFAIPSTEGDAPPGVALVMTSGAHRVDVAKVAAEVGISRLERADPDTVRNTTGFAIGGVAPIGHLTPPRIVVVDTALADFPQVWAAAGHARTVFPTSYAELLQLTGGIGMPVA